MKSSFDYDYIIIGSGFGGSVSALRLSKKGYKVLVIEKGKWFKATDFPKNNWQLRKWLWEPILGCYGFFRMTFLNHISVVHGVGVGGGSLTYANTLPVPKKEFFDSGSWASLADWKSELEPFYKLAYKMLGAIENPKLFDADLAVLQLAKNHDIEDRFNPTKVAVYFGKPEQTVSDPFFDGKGPDRTGCRYCGACMTGCRYNSKNTLDKNYLYLAQQLGTTIMAKKEVYDVRPIDVNDSSKGYTVFYKDSIGFNKKKNSVTSKGVIFSGGVLGTVPLLLKLKKNSLPNLSNLVGQQVRTNNEALMFVTSLNSKDKDYSKGLAIGSKLQVDKNSTLEPTRYGKGSSFFRLMSVPRAQGSTILARFVNILLLFIKQPIRILRTIFIKNFSSKTTILLFMQTLDSTLSLKLGKITNLKSVAEKDQSPSAFIPEAKTIAEKYADIVDGVPFAGVTDVILGNPTTAHILGGAVMGKDIEHGVIDKDNKVFGYDNMYVCDGSMISANPGVNPALSITAISERAMSKIS